MSAAFLKRPRGRPPLQTARKRDYQARTIRLRQDGTPVKAPKRITVEQLEAWLEAQRGRFWTGRGRPPTGQVPWAKAAAAHFAIAQRTVLRLVATINQRRARAARSLSLDAASAGMLAALTERYRRASQTAFSGVGPPPTSGTPARSVRGSQPSGPTPGIVIPPLDPHSLQVAIARYLEQADEAFLHSLAALIARRLPRSNPPPPALGRGLDAIGLQTAPLHPLAPRPVPGPVNASDPIRSALIESLDAAASTGGNAQVMAAVATLRRLLEAPAALTR
jgi:hypothetical protein